MLALVVERALVEALEQQLELLLEQLAIGVGVDQRRAEGLHLAGVIAAADAHDDAAIGDDVGHGIVLGQADRVPHRQDVEGAAELEPLGLGGEPQSELDQVGEDLVALALEVVLGRPQDVEAEPVHGLRDVARGRKGLPQPLVGIAPVVGRGAVEADIVELDLADIEDVEVSDHLVVPTRSIYPCRGSDDSMCEARLLKMKPEPTDLAKLVQELRGRAARKMNGARRLVRVRERFAPELVAGYAETQHRAAG